MNKSYINAYIAFWANAFDFKGRSTRTEYFVPFITNFMISLVMGFITNFGHTPNHPTIATLYFDAIWASLTIIPHLSVTIRRLHDTGRDFKWSIPEIIMYTLFLTSDMNNITGEINTNQSTTANIGFTHLMIAVLLYAPLIAYTFKLINILFEESDSDNQWGPEPVFNSY